MAGPRPRRSNRTERPPNSRVSWNPDAGLTITWFPSLTGAVFKKIFRCGQLFNRAWNSIYTDIASVASVTGSLDSPHFLSQNGRYDGGKHWQARDLPNIRYSFQKA